MNREVPGPLDQRRNLDRSVGHKPTNATAVEIVDHDGDAACHHARRYRIRGLASDTPYAQGLCAAAPVRNNSSVLRNVQPC